MGIRNTRTEWGWPARLLHWGMAALILFQIGLGVWMTNAVEDISRQFALYQLHKSWGFVIFALALVRIVWRLTHPAPEMPRDMHQLEALLARGAHLALYVLMVALPISGWLMASASTLQEQFGIENMIFDLFALPDPFQPGSKRLEELFESVHVWSATAMAVILLGHVGAALRHHFLRRDRVLMRMVLGR